MEIKDKINKKTKSLLIVFLLSLLIQVIVIIFNRNVLKIISSFLFVIALACFIACIILLMINKYYLDKIDINKYFKIFDNVHFICVVFLIFYSFNIFVFTTSRVDGKSMEDTLSNNDYVLVNHFFYTPKLNDIVVLDASNYNDGKEELYVKRVVAVPGDSYEFIDNGDKIKFTNGNVIELYDKKGLITQLKENEEIPNNHFVLVGDNRENSHDSRNFGLVNGNDII